MLCLGSYRAAGSVRRDGAGSRDKTATSIQQQQIEGVHMPLSDASRGKIRELTESGQPAEVLQSLEQRGICVDASTYKLLLRRCTHTRNLMEGRNVHLHIIKTGFKPDVYLLNALLNMFCKCGSLLEARKVFDTMQVRDMISWTLMLAVYAKHGSNREAYLLYEQLRDQGVKCDMLMYTSIVSACARLGDLEKAKVVHSDIIQSGIAMDVFLKSNLVHMYVRCGSLVEARKVFDAMQERAAITWTFMLAGYAKQGLNQEAFKLYEQVQKEGVRCDRIMYTSIVSVCASLGDLEKAKTVHNDMIKSGIRTDVILDSNLIHMYARCGSMKLAGKVFHKMAERNVVSWNALIAGSVQNGNYEEAFKVFQQMQQERVKPDYVTFINLLNACASPVALKQGQWVHKRIVSAGLETDVHVGNALITMFVKCGTIRDAQQVFDNMKVRDVISWSAMIEGYAEHGPYERALEVFQQMESHASVKPNTVTFIGLLKACANQASQQSARLVHTWIAAAGLESNIRVGNGLINMYAKCGSIKDAYNTFNTMPEKDLVTWSAMIVGLGQHGYAREALQLFHELISEGVKPDGVVFIGVLSACSHAGLVDEGLQYFFSMSRVHGISPGDEHFGCVVDLLGRAGHLDEAEDFVNKMPLSPGGATWGAVLGACRLHGNVKLAERAAEICFKLEPQNSAVYMSLSHVYATAGLWNKATSLRKLMKERGIKKEAGRSWIEVANKTHSFRSGDTAHPQIAEIWSELDNLTTEMEEAGYVPDTRWVMQDVDEHKSRQILRCHSEKLAIAFGLISTPPGSIIHIWKNLRICGDCHTASKFISKLRGREIIARDANRFHQFRDGMCSCGDYF